jgi:hypothetical protein
MKTPLVAVVATLAAIICLPLATLAEDQKDFRGPILLDVQLAGAVKLARLRPGGKLQGKVKHGVYWGERELIPSGSAIELTVSTTQRQRRKPGNRWPWVVRLLGARKANCPSSLAAMVSRADGSKYPLSVTLVSSTYEMKLMAREESAASSPGTQASRVSGSHKGRQGSAAAPTLLLKVDRPPTDLLASRSPVPASPVNPGSIAPGTLAHVILLRDLRASTSHAGDTFLARVLEPVYVNSMLALPEGALVRGKVVRSVAPRWLYRPAALSLSFTQLKLPTGEEIDIAASPTGVAVDRNSTLRMDAEGGLIGARPGKARLLIDLGVAGGTAKVTDDSLQLVIEALVSTATDVSTAGGARIAAAAVSGIYLLTRHGRDVTLPQYTNVDITFDRPALLMSSTR